jgi:competence protein ComEC
MAAVGLIPALSLLAGAAYGTASAAAPSAALGVALLALAASTSLWFRRAGPATLVWIAIGHAAAGVALAAHDRDRALHSALRQALDADVGGFDIDSLGPEADHDPVLVRGVLLEDAAARDEFVSLRVRVRQLATRGGRVDADGGVSLTVGGRIASGLAAAWQAGRTIEVPVTFRRPARYLNEGVPDFERQLALDGTSLFASAKSGLLVSIVERGSWIEERAAQIRAHVRASVARWVGRHDLVAAGIVTAVLIGDRTGLPDDVRDRLQAAGTYHVIAISGGNIAVLAGLTLAVLMFVGLRNRRGALGAIVLLLAYAQVASAGPSVWRATLMAVLYLGAQLLDHRTSPCQAAAMAASVMVAAQPLDIRDPGFVLTFGATAALLEGARRGARFVPAHRVLAWFTASVAASFAAEIALLPVSAHLFSRVTSAGLVLNLIAVPMMAVAQVAGLVVTLFARCDAIASAAGWIAFAAAAAIVETARLVEIAPWLARRVASPGTGVLVLYYGALLTAVYTRSRRVRQVAGVTLVLCLLAAVGIPAVSVRGLSPPMLRLTMFDVGQGEAMLLEGGGEWLQIDTGGVPFGSGAFDIGARVLAPALWARDVRRLDALLLTHGDPDHAGGAAVLLDAFNPRRLLEGVIVPRHQPTQLLRDGAIDRGIAVRQIRLHDAFRFGPARVRVLHPPAPDWERPRVRNDDSVVLEVLHGDVALLLTGDISSEIERVVVPHLTQAPVRILKVAHHGSRTSTSQYLLDEWQPQIALISAGRGNTFGHPAPEVLQRLQAAGTRIYRTDLHGQITFTTDGREIDVTTYVGGQP